MKFDINLVNFVVFVNLIIFKVSADQCKPATSNIQCCSRIEFFEKATETTTGTAEEVTQVSEAWNVFSQVFQNQSHYEFGSVKNYTWNLQSLSNPFNEAYYIREDDAYVLFYARTSGSLAGWFIDDRVSDKIWDVNVNSDYLTSDYTPSNPQTPFYQYDVVQSFPNTVQICPNDMDYTDDEEFNIVITAESTYFKLSLIGKKLEISCIDQITQTIEVSSVNGVSSSDTNCNYLGIPVQQIDIITGAYDDMFSNFTIDYDSIEPIDTDPIFWIILGCHLGTLCWLVAVGWWFYPKKLEKVQK